MSEWPQESANEAADLTSTVEEIRESNFPNLDRELVAEILAAQRRYAENRAEGQKATEQIVNRWVADNVHFERRN